ncbi:uncharacterized protein IL334_002956 [Kwoniella shivajii]|uniref:PEHE domain-containing protein n=1 Tax=Kwoniella shivajii TaxID=564305 RepID=A0ABZ1CXW0_9TREE|nr:hypothetical protein IL334_002956 [Kwoniella shivajii]
MVSNLSLSEIQTNAEKLFNPNFKLPRKTRTPIPPSLSWSKLPPPAAEIDERPTARLRRFKKWKDVVPELRLVILDPKKRIHLRRYQSYAVPATMFSQRRKVLPIPLFRCTRPGLLNADVQVKEWSWSTPVKAKTSSAKTVIHDTPTEPSFPQRQEMKFTLSSSSGVDPPEHPIKSMLVARPAPCSPLLQSTHPSPPSHPSSTFPYTCTPPSPSPPSPYWIPPLPDPLPWHDESIPRRHRKAIYQRLLEHKWILDQEHERRFRIGMSKLMDDIIEWQETMTIPFDQWKKGHKWKPEAALTEIEQTTEFFKAIRKKSLNIFLYLDPEQISYVPFRQRVHDLVKDEENRKKRTKERKEARNQAKAQAQVEAESKAQSTLLNQLLGNEQTQCNDKSITSGHSLDGQSEANLISQENFGKEPSIANPQSPQTQPVENSSRRHSSPSTQLNHSAFEEDRLMYDRTAELSNLISRLFALRRRKHEISNELKNREDNGQAEERYLNNPIDAESNIIHPDRPGQVVSPLQNSKSELKNDQKFKSDLEAEVAMDTGLQENVDVYDYKQLNNQDRQERGSSVSEIELEPHHASITPSASTSLSTVHPSQDDLDVRYGSLNLDEDTALPPNTCSPDSSCLDETPPSSAYSRKQASLLDISDISQSSSCGKGRDAETLIAGEEEAHEEERDTLYSAVLTGQATLI